MSQLNLQSLNQPNSSPAAGETIIVNPVEVEINNNITVPEIRPNKSAESMHSPNRPTNQIQVPN